MSTPMLQLQVWHLRIEDISDSDLRLGLSWLSTDELSYFRGCRSEQRKLEFALGRLLLRSALSHLHSDRSPGEWRITKGPHGRPLLDADEPFVSFSLTHSDDRIVLVTGPVPKLGIDLEYGLNRRNVERLARRWFNNPEVEELMQLPPEDRLAWFYQLWTLKEAWSKALGDALAPSLRRITVTGATTREICVALADDEAAHWQFFQLQAGPGFHCALACECRMEIRLVSRRMLGLARFETMDTQILRRAARLPAQ